MRAILVGRLVGIERRLQSWLELDRPVGLLAHHDSVIQVEHLGVDGDQVAKNGRVVDEFGVIVGDGRGRRRLDRDCRQVTLVAVAIAAADVIRAAGPRTFSFSDLPSLPPSTKGRLSPRNTVLLLLGARLPANPNRT